MTTNVATYLRRPRFERGVRLLAVALVFAAALLQGEAALGAVRSNHNGSTSQRESAKDALNRRASSTTVEGHGAQHATLALNRLADRIDSIRRLLPQRNGFIDASDDLLMALLFDRSRAFLQIRHGLSVDHRSDYLEDHFAALDSGIDALMAEVARLAPTYSTPSVDCPCDPRLLSAVERGIKAAVPDAELRKAGFIDAEWTTRTNRLNIPVARTRTGFAIYRVPGYDWYIGRIFVVERRLVGGDSGDDELAILLRGVRFQRDE